MKKIAAYLLSLVATLGAVTAQAEEGPFSLDLGLRAGYTQESLEIEVPYDDSGTPNSIRFGFDRMRYATLGLEASLWYEQTWFLRGSVDQSVTGPRTQMDLSDHNAVQRADVQRRSSHNSTALQMLLGYRFSGFEPLPQLALSPYVGMNFGVKSPGRFDDLDVSWDPRFTYFGPLMGLDVDLAFCERWAIEGGIAYEWRTFRTHDRYITTGGGGGIAPLDPPAELDLGRFRAYGLHWKLGLHYDLNEAVRISLLGRYALLTRKTDRTIFVDPDGFTPGEQSSNVKAKMKTWSISGQISYLFF